MKRRLLIAGCGYVGLALSHELRQKNFQVWGLRRDAAAKSKIEATSATFLCADLTKPKTLRNLPQVDYIVSCQAPRRGQENYITSYFTGAQNLIHAVSAKPPKCFLWVSSTSVYGDFKGEWVNEDTKPRAATENAKALLEAESIVLNAPFPSLVLRLGGIYGPGRDRIKLLQEGLVSTKDPGYLNHIHVDDVARLIAFLLECGTSKQVYLGVDDEPVLRSEFYAWLADGGRSNRNTLQSARVQGVPVGSAPGSRSQASRRCSNQKIKQLGFQFKWPTYREGFGTVLYSTG